VAGGLCAFGAIDRPLAPAERTVVSEQNPSSEPAQPGVPPNVPPPPAGAPLPPPGSPPPPPPGPPGPPGDETFGTAPQAPQAAPVKKKSKLVPILIIVGVVLLALCGGAIFLVANVLGDSAVNAKVGDCFEASVFTSELTDAQGTTTVECTDPDAKYKVVGIVEGKTFEEMDVNADCQQWATAVAGIWFGEEGEKGKVFCVEDITA
jgi:hypothetical protein